MAAFREGSDDEEIGVALSEPEPQETTVVPGVRRRRVRVGARPKVLAQRELRRIVGLDPRGPRDGGSGRPRVRGDCEGGQRPCPWAGCKYHLALSVNPDSGAVTMNFPDKELWELAETCALDVADRGGVTLEVVGQLTNVTRERVRQVEVKALLLLRQNRQTPR